MILQITPPLLKEIAIFAPVDKTELYAPYMETYTELYDIRTVERLSSFLGQIIHESGSFKYVRELASGKAYEGRKDLGNVYPGDGIRFKGRGLIQITGRTNYAEVSEALKQDFVNHPEYLELPLFAVRSACWWWHSRGLNDLADKKDFRRITRTINGGYNGYEDRLFWYDRAKHVLTNKTI